MTAGTNRRISGQVGADDDDRVARVEQWRLDNGTRLDMVSRTLRAVLDDRGITRTVLGERDGSLQVRPLNGTGQDSSRRAARAGKHLSLQYPIT